MPICRYVHRFLYSYMHAWVYAHRILYACAHIRIGVWMNVCLYANMSPYMLYSVFLLCFAKSPNYSKILRNLDFLIFLKAHKLKPT